MRAGRLLALVYLLCVMAPSLAFAIADGSLAAPCLVENEHGMGIVHVHHETGTAHVHADGHSHHHADVGSGSAEHQEIQTAPDDDSAPADHRHKSADGSCCGMVCVSALPAAVLDLSKPSASASRCAVEAYRRMADDPLPTPYRPPSS
jgi:hypothetical protein